MVGIGAIALVAQLSVLQGHASIGRAEGGGVMALRNTPIVTGDDLTTTSASDAEIELDALVSVRLDAASAVRIVGLAPHRRDLRLEYGTIDVSAQRNGDSPRIETPAATLAPDAPGLFRVSVTHRVSSVSVRRGTLRILTPNGTQVLAPGETVTIDGLPSAPTLSYASPSPPDAFDGFNETRDAARRDLDALSSYGTWISLTAYGRVWRPREFSGWAPYQIGRWLWRRDLGWTWIPHESWGWLPYHFGAWTYDARDGWCWVPPHAWQPAPAWSAATAVFFAVVAAGRISAIGWTPLAPAERYHDTLAAYRNASAPGGVHVTGIGDFYSGAFAHVSSPTVQTLPAGLRMVAPNHQRNKLRSIP